MFIANSKQNVLILQIGMIDLLIQNLIFLIGLTGLVPKNLLPYDFYMDIIGFIFLGIGYILYSQQEVVSNVKAYFFKGGILILLWIALRVIWQIILGGNVLFSNISNTNANNLTDYLPVFFNTIRSNIDILIAFIPAGIALGIASVFIYRIKKDLGTKKNLDGTFFLIFGLSNMIIVFIMSLAFFGLVITGIRLFGLIVVIVLALKLLLIPFLAIIAFVIMLITVPKLNSTIVK